MPSKFTPKDVAIDFNIKLMLETRLAIRINKFHNKLATQLETSLRKNGTLPNFDASEAELEQILNSHYTLVGEVFVARINEMVLDEIEKELVPVVEKSYQAVAMETLARRKTSKVPIVVDRHFKVKASEMSSKITKTTKKEAKRALAEVKKISRNPAGVGVVRVDIASQTGAIFRTTMNGRSSGIVRLNTNATAEATKLTQIQLLRGEQPSLAGGGASKGTKTWTNMADSRVRGGGGDPFDHTRSNQTVKLDKPFRVSGESLKYPGDQSLGASLGNVVGCRCAVSYDIKQVVKKIKKGGVLGAPPVSTSARATRAVARNVIAEASEPAVNFRTIAKISSDVSEAAIVEMETAWARIPRNVQRMIADENIPIRLGRTAARTSKLKVNENFVGFFDPKSRSIHLGEKILSNGKLKTLRGKGRTLIHEVGHAVDDFLRRRNLGGRNESSFIKAFRKGVERAEASGVNATTGELEYFISKVNEVKHNLGETFAESFASAYADASLAGRRGKLFNKIMLEATDDVIAQAAKVKPTIGRIGSFKPGKVQGAPPTSPLTRRKPAKIKSNLPKASESPQFQTENLREVVDRKKLDDLDDYVISISEDASIIDEDEVMEAVESYVNSSERINSALRRESATRKVFPDVVEKIELIDAAIDGAKLSDDVVGFRGISKQYLDKINPKVGTEFSDKAFASWTGDRGTASDFMRIGANKTDGAIMRMKIPKDSKAIFIEPGEYEIILPRNTKYRVVEIEDGVPLRLDNITQEPILGKVVTLEPI